MKCQYTVFIHILTGNNFLEFFKFGIFLEFFKFGIFKIEYYFRL